MNQMVDFQIQQFEQMQHWETGVGMAKAELLHCQFEKMLRSVIAGK